MKLKNSIQTSRGFSLIEILSTMIIVLIGLLGIAALQIKAQTAELESFQRAQALIILSNIVDTLNVNRETASCFRLTTDATNGTPYLGVNDTVGTPTCTASTATYNAQAVAAINEIDDLLDGVAAQLAGADVVNVGAMIGARACINYDATTEIGGNADTGLYTISVSWQGMSELAIPTTNCANNTYGAEGQRRTVSVTTRIANLN